MFLFIWGCLIFPFSFFFRLIHLWKNRLYKSLVEETILFYMFNIPGSFMIVFEHRDLCVPNRALKDAKTNLYVSAEKPTNLAYPCFLLVQCLMEDQRKLFRVFLSISEHTRHPELGHRSTYKSDSSSSWRYLKIFQIGYSLFPYCFSVAFWFSC